MKTIFSFFIIATCLIFVGCTSSETKEQKQKYEFENSISSPQNKSTISDVNIRFLTDPETRSIWEIFTGKEFGHGRLFLRTQPENRTGLYFFVMFDTYQMNILEGSKITLFVHSEASKDVQEFTFDVKANSSLLRELALGITGSDAKRVSDKVLAWKIVVKSPDGKVITQGQSWLWSIPENKNK